MKEKLKVQINGKITEIDFENLHGHYQKRESHDGLMMEEDQCVYPRLFKFLKKIQRISRKTHGKISYESVKRTYTPALEYLPERERDLIVDWMENRGYGEREGMNKYEYRFFIKEIENKLQEFIMLKVNETPTVSNTYQRQVGN